MPENSVNSDCQFLDDVISGLSSDQKYIPCKYFYDEIGSELFDQICELEEYYPTRTETKLIRDNVGEMAAQLGKGVLLVEFGSGSSTKTEWLLRELQEPAGYVPLDISSEHLEKTAESLREQFPEIEICPVVGDFTQSFEIPETEKKPSHLAIFFPGSTIGNFQPAEARLLLQQMHELLGPKGGVLIGIDLQKAPDIIHAAYNDSLGVTARFNLNVLERVNRELDGDFEVEQFEHLATYNQAAGRVELYLVSLVEQEVTISGETFRFKKDERIFTEYSHKYTIPGFEKMADDVGFRLHKSWTDANDWFAVLHLVREV